ncbi:hypothetical protein ACNAN0_11535 [Agrilactobacillus fermenti]|uniref:hypothetical protein n=1 Tax=Agrilactobacillus fermenti TaxID=2586909 RepID=UPI003A5C6189
MTIKKAQAEMSQGDFQRLLQIALSDLRIRRTLLENHMADVQAEPRSLEQDDEIDRTEQQIQRIAADYRHYQTFVDEAIAKTIDVSYEQP